MILYLCSNQNINLFDFLDKDRGLPIKKMSGTFKLKQFVIHDVRNLSQFSFFIIDLKALKDTENEIIEAIVAFETMYSARIIMFSERLDGSSPLISKLIDIGVYNIITSTNFEDIKEEVLLCVSPDGKDKHSAIRIKYSSQKVNKQPERKCMFLCRGITIAVAGAAQKVGATTIAFNLANFLAALGADVAYIEANANGHLSTLPDYYKDMNVTETHFEYKGVKYYSKGKFPDENNFTIIDFGTVSQTKPQLLKQCDLLILCGTTKPYELSSVKTAIKMIDGMYFSLIMSHTPQKAKSEIKNMFSNGNVSIYFSGYSPDLFDSNANAKIFTKIIKEYIPETLNENT
ncbi:MAG: hypothetical protein N2645_15385 [Clostridia bacterium]|nr:hypothetical protein [Clostridia bacterium]